MATACATDACAEIGTIAVVKEKVKTLRITLICFFITYLLCKIIFEKHNTFVKTHWIKAYAGMSSNMSVTNAAIGERSLRVNVTWANNGCPFNFSTTATTPS